MPHQYPIQLRRADMDAYGHVNNVVYLSYIDEARQDMLASATGGGDLGENVVVAKHAISYLSPLVYRPERVRVDTVVRHVGDSSFTLAHEVRDEDTSYCRVESVLVAFDAVAGVSRHITDAERSALAGLT
ncbi:acyl-CoA thioester hydrolase [Haloechinothrix alba]|uniref:Acyl-CoA thioester hydrolase n=1 Tax=Haloechinothrix alba TaxID=664784 RepID=A0A238ZYL9_9PSEU|nr:thioesterase family protein [Haloechinothrix alba]SNR88242.1 acyl-CoA thioester hydrolase [Haloechinothrix alba]